MTTPKDEDSIIEVKSFGAGLGLAVVILAIFLGIGGCCYLFDKGEALRIQAQHQGQP